MLKTSLKKYIKKNEKWLIPVLLKVSQLFFDKQYLCGRLFNESYAGFSWVLQGIWRQKILGFNRHVQWPINHTSTISNPRNIEFHPDDLNIFQTPGIYFQNFSAKIILKKGCLIAPNVGLITANHKITNENSNHELSHRQGKDIIIGENCWIGMNSVILPGVILGKNTVVAAGSVVTKSFANGHVTLAGVPAKIIKINQ